MAARGSRVAGQGTVRQLPSGKWQARLPRLIDNRPTGQRPVPGGPFPSRAEAERALTMAIARVRSGVVALPKVEPDPPPVRETVAFVVQRFLDERGPALQPNTMRGYRSDLRCTIAPPEFGIGDKLARDLTSADVAKWRDETLPAAKKSPHMVKGGMRLLRSALSWDVERDRLPNNVASGLTSRRTAEQEESEAWQAEEFEAMTWDEMARFIMAIPTELERLFILTLLWTGCRLAEGASIWEPRLDAGNPHLFIDKAWKRTDKKHAVQRRGRPYGRPTTPYELAEWELKPLKRGRRRNLWLPSQLHAALVDWRDHRRPTPRRGKKNVLFPFIGSRDGGGPGVWESGSVRIHIVVPARNLSGISSVKTKDLRANAATAFHDAGFADAQVQKMLGHAPGSEVTRKNYVRAVRDVHNPARDAVRLNPQLRPQQRLDALWAEWVRATGIAPFRY